MSESRRCSARSAAIAPAHPRPALGRLGYLDSSRRTTDAWDRDFLIECEGDDIIVISAGPDTEMGTEDDIQ